MRACRTLKTTQHRSKEANVRTALIVLQQVLDVKRCHGEVILRHLGSGLEDRKCFSCARFLLLVPPLLRLGVCFVEERMQSGILLLCSKSTSVLSLLIHTNTHYRNIHIPNILSTQRSIDDLQ